SRPTLLQATPSTFKLLLASGWQGSRSLTVGCGGEAMPLPLAEALLARTRALWNLYGQTETTIWVTAKKVEENDVAAGRISIGQALPHVGTLVLDEEGQPADTGELLILGPGVGKGYHGDPVRTAASFIDHSAGRAYRTGDLVHRLPNGELELRGRIDHQIKVRGHRIEPGEVEAALRTHAAVQDLVVMARPAEAGDLRLVAYVVPTREVGTLGLPSQLHALATRRLPAAARPQHYEVIDALPLTASGKIDRAALPEPGRTRPALATPLMRPNDALELRLTQMVGDLLHVDAVGLDDDFFELGGDSLAAVRLLVEIQDYFATELRLEAFLDQPTVRAIASALREASDHHPALPVVALRANGQGNPLFFVHGAGGLAFTTYEVGRAVAGDRPVFVLQDPATNHDVTPTQSVEALASAHLRALRQTQRHGPYTIVGHSFGGLLAYEMAVQLRADGEDVAFLGMLDTPIPPLATAPATLPERLAIWLREAHFTWQVLAQAGPMALDGLYVMFGAEARYRERTSSNPSWTERVRATWARAVFHLLQRKAGLAFAVDPASRLLMLRQPGIRRSIHLTGVHEGARRRYVPGQYDGEIHLFRARQSSAETAGFGADHALGWRGFASKVAVHWCDGSHFTMTRGANAKHLAALLDRTLIDGAPIVPPDGQPFFDKRSYRPEPNAAALETG
ncbi:MAG: thioesterase domain-containing protein, partial [Pseudomonadota bacterium]